MKKTILYGIVIAVCVFAIAGCDLKQELVFTGPTMGTTYQVKVVVGRFNAPKSLQEKIDQRLAEINRSMSTYLMDSEISRLNRWDRQDKPFAVSQDFLAVMTVANRLHKMTRGAWDGTVDPLVNVWGFGRDGNVTNIPSAEVIQRLRQQVGFDNLQVSADGFIEKKNARTSLDLGSIAKGYGVDQLARLLVDHRINHFLVEIGGEVFAAGRRKDGQKWKIGINTPRQDAAPDQVYQVLQLSDQACATSGDYRNFFEMDGRRYSHVIDPRTGYPVANGVVSVSIVAGNCTLADGLATAVMVAGVTDGMALINSLKAVEGLIVYEEKDGSLTNIYSEGMKNNF